MGRLMGGLDGWVGWVGWMGGLMGRLIGKLNNKIGL